MRILDERFDGLMLKVFNDKQLKDIPADELHERKMMYIAGAHVVMSILETIEPGKELVDILMAMRIEIDEYVNNQINK
ncbi:hypothetical protein [Myroides odoratimimus]|uniref:Uncharacterized protein n=1 Tax=Myroides odoratimimus CIP 101113 TaxID=883154 RepID=A0AAV3F567_9FLAO|nr:hypothetical protein [Myroides odoratimimus]EHO13827.1 hypothetical protein HMPREF9715_00901 [Myroides odoratimimus CIP 101113]